MWDTRGGGESGGLGQRDVLFKKKQSGKIVIEIQKIIVQGRVV